MRRGSGHGHTQRRGPRAAAVALSCVLGAAALIGNAPSANAATPAFDLTVRASAMPKNVQPGAAVRFRSVIANLGPGTAPSVALVDTLPEYATFVAAAVTPGGCSGVDPQRVVVCLVGPLAPGAAATVDVDVTATTIVGARLVNTARVVSDPADGDVTDDVTTAIATVQPPNVQKVSAFVAPGGTLATGTVAGIDDPTFSALTLPATGKGATITLTERRRPAAFCGGPCTGQPVALGAIAGYDDVQRAPVLTITYDRSLGFRPGDVNVWTERGTVASIVPKCTRPRVLPCVLSKQKFTAANAYDPSAVGDVRFRLLVAKSARFSVAPKGQAG